MPQTLLANREQVLDADDARGSASGIAVGASLLLHLGLVGFIFFRQADIKPPEAAPPKAAMVVTISSTNPQRKQPRPPSPDVMVENPVPEIATEVEMTEPVAEATTAEKSPTPEQSVAVPPTGVAPSSEAPEDQSVENSGVRGISAAEINNSVTAYIADYKSSLTGEWLSDCLRYQNEHGVKTCPQGEDGKSETIRSVTSSTSQLFRVYISGGAENARASKKLLEEMEAMQPFLEENSIMGELARQRYQLAKANYCQLNHPCRGAATSTSGSFATPISNEGGIAIASFSIGAGGLRVQAGLGSIAIASFSIGADGLRIESDLNNLTEPKPSAVKLFVPYRFTAAPEDRAESGDEFEVEAPLFPIRR